MSSALAVAPEQCARWSRDSITEESTSRCSERAATPPQASAYPSPYRASTAAAFADINRALAVRSLRDSVCAGPYASQLPPSYLVRPGPSPSSPPPTHATNTGRVTHVEDPSSPSHAHGGRSRSLPSNMWRRKDSENERVFVGGRQASSKRRSILHVRKNQTVPAKLEEEGDENEDKCSTLGPLQNGPERRTMKESGGSRQAFGGVTSTYGKGSSRRNRATSCVIM